MFYKAIKPNNLSTIFNLMRNKKIKGQKKKMITTGFGLGMFLYNLVCSMIGLAIIYIIIRNIR